MPSFLNRLRTSSILSPASFAGPNRLLMIGGVTASVLLLTVVVALWGSSTGSKSMAGKLPAFDPSPGGLHSNPEQDKLALRHSQEQADDAARHGRSFTPAMAASDPLTPPVAAPGANAPVVTHGKLTPADWFPPRPKTTPRKWGRTMPDPAVQMVAQTTQADAADDRLYSGAVNRLLRGWDGKPPQTEVIIQPVNHELADGQAGLAEKRAFGSNTAASSTGALLMPAGRGIFAHTVLAVDSDSGGPIVLQADSGPLSGDRMIGTFSKAGANGGSAADRLVVRVNSIEHQGQSIATDAIVIAPDTMETTVASSVDEHYLSRFVLPAAAAFVQGLGQAFATTSNTTGELNALGGQSYITHLNLPQQLGVGAGVAAGQIGNTLSQQAPHSPTIHLDANCDVGVMFLSPVHASAIE
jgi:intracellular multiplication protein IcmE